MRRVRSLYLFLSPSLHLLSSSVSISFNAPLWVSISWHGLNIGFFYSKCCHSKRLSSLSLTRMSFLHCVFTVICMSDVCISSTSNRTKEEEPRACVVWVGATVTCALRVHFASHSTKDSQWFSHCGFKWATFRRCSVSLGFKLWWVTFACICWCDLWCDLSFISVAVWCLEDRLQLTKGCEKYKELCLRVGNRWLSFLHRNLDKAKVNVEILINLNALAVNLALSIFQCWLFIAF